MISSYILGKILILIFMAVCAWEDYKNQSPENSAVIHENIKVVMKKYDLSREEADAILMDLLGVHEE